MSNAQPATVTTSASEPCALASRTKGSLISAGNPGAPTEARSGASNQRASRLSDVNELPGIFPGEARVILALLREVREGICRNPGWPVGRAEQQTLGDVLALLERVDAADRERAATKTVKKKRRAARGRKRGSVGRPRNVLKPQIAKFVKGLRARTPVVSWKEVRKMVSDRFGKVYQPTTLRKYMYQYA